MKEWSFQNNFWQFVILVVVCYFIGCFNFARVISRKNHKDITKMGSGNPGTMNMSREFGLKIGAITFFCDVFKGGLPCLISYFIYRNYCFSGTEVRVSDLTRYLCGVCVVIGHIFPVTQKFKGGKGIASTFGLFWFNMTLENPWFCLFSFLFLVFVLLYIKFTEWGSMASLIGVAGFTLWQGVIFFVRYQGTFSGYLVTLFALLLLIDILTWSAHHKNVIRLVSGEEHHTSVGKHKEK